MPAFTIKKDDLEPALNATLSLVADGTPLDLTDAVSVAFRMWRQRVTGGAYKASGAATIVDAAAGTVRYTWAAGDTSEAGDFLAEFVVTWAGSRPQTVPTAGAIHVRVEDGGLPG